MHTADAIRHAFETMQLRAFVLIYVERQSERTFFFSRYVRLPSPYRNDTARRYFLATAQKAAFACSSAAGSPVRYRKTAAVSNARNMHGLKCITI